MKRTIIIALMLALTTIRSSFGQDFREDIKDGLYLWSAGLVIQQISDTLRVFKLMESKQHFYKVADAVPDSHKLFGEEHPIPRESYPMPDAHKPTDMVIKASKITAIPELGASRFSIIFPAKKGFNSANFIKRDFGYEMYFSNHDVKEKKLKESIIRDTTSYFTIYAFTLTDLRSLEQLKKFNAIDRADIETLFNSIQNRYIKNRRILKNNMTFGIRIEGYESYGIIESREMIIKSLLELKYNPLIDPDELGKTRDKLKMKK